MRGFLITIILGVGLFAGVAWYFNLPPFAASAPVTPPEDSAARENREAQELGPELYKPVKLEPLPRDPMAPQQLTDPIVIDGHLVVTEKQEVPSTRAGQILWIGEEVSNAERETLPPEQVMSATVLIGPREVVKYYRRLEEGHRVKKDQMVAMLDYSIALNDWTSKKAKIGAAKADFEASIKTKLEAQARLDRMDNLRAQSAKFVTPEDYSATVLTRDRYLYEEIAKKEAVKQAEIDAEQAQIILKQHEIRNKIPGTSIVKTLYKHRGEAVKEQEQILQLYNIDRVRAEGLVEVQYRDRLKVGAKASLEPIEEKSPLRVFNEHRGEVTGVAVSGHEKDARIVSGSLDGTVRIWSPTQSQALRVMYLPAPVRVVACSPRDCKRNWLLAGCGDGSLRLWDLDKDSDQPVWDSTKSDQVNPQRDAITALAFSPDGSLFATGCEDDSIVLWKVDGGQCKVVYPFDPAHGVEGGHQGDITALHFTPQCSLVSASRDNTIRVWKLREKGAHMVGEPITGRGGSVANLGVSEDGRWMLLDYGKLLQVISLADGRAGIPLKNPTGTTPFETLALFSSDGSLILTAGAPDGRLQLWRAPVNGKRGYEVRQFATVERSPVTCAAFAPDAGIAADGSFAVSGTKDGYVYVWPVPNRDKVNHHRMEGLELTLVENTLDASTRQVRIGVNVRNPINDEYPIGRLVPGRPVNIVIEPE
jgi:WD40 repeat protein